MWLWVLAISPSGIPTRGPTDSVTSHLLIFVRCIKLNKVYEWDEFQKAWFPKVTEDFLANYQATYGSMR